MEDKKKLTHPILIIDIFRTFRHKKVRYRLSFTIEDYTTKWVGIFHPKM